MKEKIPTTQAIRVLRDNKIDFTPHFYKYVEKGGSGASSQALGVDEYVVIKTLIMEDENKKPFIVLMHGNKSVSQKELARYLGVKTVVPCAPNVADKHSGYMVGGTSPFGTKRAMKTYIERSILELDKIYINGGKRGFLIEIEANDLLKVLDYELVDVQTD